MEDEKSMDLDLYVDLLTSETEQAISGEVQDKFNEQQQQIDNLKSQNEQLERLNKTLLRNISSLFKTAKLEISRKDKRLQELQHDLDSLIFKRNRGFKHTGKSYFKNEISNNARKVFGKKDSEPKAELQPEASEMNAEFTESRGHQLGTIPSSDEVTLESSSQATAAKTDKLLPDSSPKENDLKDKAEDSTSVEQQPTGSKSDAERIKKLQQQISSAIINKYKMKKKYDHPIVSEQQQPMPTTSETVETGSLGKNSDTEKGDQDITEKESSSTVEKSEPKKPDSTVPIKIKENLGGSVEDKTRLLNYWGRNRSLKFLGEDSPEKSDSTAFNLKREKSSLEASSVPSNNLEKSTHRKSVSSKHNSDFRCSASQKRAKITEHKHKVLKMTRLDFERLSREKTKKSSVINHKHIKNDKHKESSHKKSSLRVLKQHSEHKRKDKDDYKRRSSSLNAESKQTRREKPFKSNEHDGSSSSNPAHEKRKSNVEKEKTSLKHGSVKKSAKDEKRPDSFNSVSSDTSQPHCELSTGSESAVHEEKGKVPAAFTNGIRHASDIDNVKISSLDSEHKHTRKVISARKSKSPLKTGSSRSHANSRSVRQNDHSKGEVRKDHASPLSSSRSNKHEKRSSSKSLPKEDRREKRKAEEPLEESPLTKKPAKDTENKMPNNEMPANNNNNVNKDDEELEEGEILSDDEDDGDDTEVSNRSESRSDSSYKKRFDRNDYLRQLEENKKKMELRRRNVLLAKAKESKKSRKREDANRRSQTSDKRNL